MATISLKIAINNGAIMKTIQLDPSTTVYDACRIIREKLLEADSSEPKEYGLFLTSEEDNKKGIWLEASRTLDYYILRNNDVLHYMRKMRNLRVRMLDGTVKTLLVDDSQIVANLMVVICTKIGITNYDEYGLVREDQKEECDPCEKPNYGTLTLKRKHQEKERDAKMDQLRKKLRTDDEVNWVEPSKTLREQGIDVTETLLLRRKLFFSDRNVDSRDPVQLNLLYVQARDAILDGTHPVTSDKACEFAGIQCQIQFGDHKEDKHTPGFLDLKEFLPQSYVKSKGIEKRVWKEHKQHLGLSELDAKVLYTKSARALPTYGVAFFLVKEKMKGKNKLVPRLLGVTKDSVLRLDERTKEILQSWPLTTVRRWCASPNTFTLDFGDYSDQYYSVQTSEAEQILQVIAGYIDIILRKQRAKEHLGVEGDEGSAMMEDTVAPHRANIIQHDTFKPKNVNTESVAKPAVLRPGEGPKAFAVSHMTTMQQTTISGQIITGHTPPNVSQSQQSKSLSIQSEPQRALLSTISEGKEIIRHTQEELTRAVVPPEQGVAWRGVTVESSRRQVSQRVAHMNAATAELVTLTSGPTEEVDHSAVGAAITTITENLPEMTKGVSMLAALMEDTDNGDRLLDATRKLCSAFSDLLTAAQPHDDKEPRQHLLNAASKVGEASTSVLQTIGEEPQDKETQDILLSLAKAVANTTAALVLKAKNVAAQCKDDQQLQNSIISAATQCALATSQLVACTKVVAPTIQNPACREQLSRATRQVHVAVETLLESCDTTQRAGGEELVSAASAVTEALKTLLQHCETDRVTRTTSASVVESVVSASEGVTSARDVTQLVQNARALGHATATLVTHIKSEAERQGSEKQRKLLAAAKLLADATARMVEAARQCASAPQDREKQETLRRAAEELKFITVDYAQGQDIVGSQIARLQDTARQATSSATELITAAHKAIQYNTNKYSQEQLLSECSQMSSELGRVLEASRLVNKNEPGAPFHLIVATESFLQSSSAVPGLARAAAATVPHAHTHRELSAASTHFSHDSHALESAINRAKISCKGLELDSALEIINSVQQNLGQPPQGPPIENPSQQISVWSRSAQSCVAQMWSAVSRGDLSAASRLAPRLATDLHQLAAASEHVDHPDKDKIIEATRQTMYSAQVFVEYIQRYSTSTETVSVRELRTVADTLTQSLDRVMESVPSHAELDEAIENVNETLHVIEDGECPTSERTYSELQSSLHTAAADLHDAATSIVDNSSSSSQLCSSSKHFNNAFNSLLPLAMEMSSHHEDIESRTEIISAMKSLTINSSRLLSNAKSYSQDVTRANGRSELTESARAVTESINKLVDVCCEAAPGQKECAAAVRTIESTRPLLRRPTSPLVHASYFATLDACVAQSKALSEGMSGIASSAKSGANSEFCSHVTRTAEHVASLVEHAAHQAYLIGISHVDSTPGRCGLVSSAALSRAANNITQAAATLRDPNTHRHQVLAAATVIAKYTSALCNLCRDASAKSESAAKRHFVQAAKDVANSTADLVKEIKKIDNDVSLDYTKENMARCSAATLPLESAVKSLCQFANSPEFAAVPARIPPQASAPMDEILDTAGHIITSSCGMLQSAAFLLPAPTDRAHWHSLATHSKALSDHIKALLTSIREKVPGQVELATAQQQVTELSSRLERAAMDLADNKLPPAPGDSMEGYSEQIESSAAEALDRLEALRRGAKFEAENIPHHTVHTMQYIEVLMSSVIGCVRHMSSWKAQGSLLDRARTVLETLSAALRAAAASQGNHNATTLHPQVESTFSSVSESVRELVECSRSECAQQGDIGPCLETLQRDMQTLQQNRMSLVGSYEETDSFVDYQTRMVETAKEIARLASDMRAKAATSPASLSVAGAALTETYSALSHDALPAALAHPQPLHADSIRSSVIEVGEAIEALVRAGGMCRQHPNKDNQQLVSNKATLCNEKVVKVLVALRSGSRGTQACIEAAATLQALSSELATTVLFATAGTLQSDKEGDTFSNHRESILKTAKSLVEETKRLVGGAAGTQDQLADAAQSAVTTVVQLCDVVKLGAMSLGSNSAESQVLLLNGARDVTQALRDLAIATKGASGHHVSHPHMETLKHAAKVMVTNVTSLLKTVKAVEDEHTRGIRALESTIEAINQEISVLLSPAPPPSTATAEELIRHTRHMTVATTRAVAAANSNKQDDLTAAANGGRKTVVDLLHCCKGAAFSAETTELRDATIDAGRETALAYRDLLQLVLECAQSQGNINELAEKSRAVAAALHHIIAQAQRIKGSEWVDPEDPTVIAETELLGAAASIDAAARKLDSLRPRRSIAVQEADESLNFDEMILEAARAIVAATSALVRAASSAQRELIDTGVVSRRPAMSSDDGQWSEGLVSGARLVAAAAHSLVEAANALVQGAGSEERLISSARQVASSTAQLLVACKVKADPSSESTRRLQTAGAEVIRSTDNLVRAARDSITHDEERSLVLNRRMVGGIAQEIDARTEVLRIEKELEEARGRLSAIRQAKYKLRGDTSGDETEGWTSDVSTAPYRLQTPNSSYMNTTYSPNSTFTQNQTQNTTNLSSHISNLNQSVHGPTQAASPGYTPNSPGYAQNSSGYTQNSPGYIPTSPGYAPTSPGYAANSPGFNQSAAGYNQSATGYNQSTTGYGQTTSESQTNGSFAQGPTFSSFRPQDEAPKQNYEGFTTRCETRLYDQPRSVTELSKTEEQRMYESSQFIKQEQKYDTTKLTSPLSPKFNARNLKHDSDKNQSFFPNLNRPKYGDGIGQSFTEHQKSSEAIPGGHKQSEFTIKSESYQSYPQKDISFATSTPTKFDAFERKDLNQYKSTDLVKAATPDYERVVSPYGKEVYSHSGPNYLEETTTEVKDVPNGTQKITTTKIYSSSPVNLTSTNTKFEPIKLEGIDELSKFDNDSKYSTLDSKYSVDSKISSDTSRSFMRPSEFKVTDYQSSSNTTKVLKPAPKEISKEIDNIDKKFSKQTITSERIEKRSVTTSSHKQETKSTVTKKFGNV